jgi:hypothetical protein
MRRRIGPLVLAVLVAVAAVLAGCARRPRPVQTVTYSPTAYGEVLDGQGRCYYLDDPFETRQLISSGMCDPSWVAYPMPGYWHNRYAAFYASPFYVNRFVVVEHRQTFSRAQGTYVTDHASEIKAEAKQAKMVGSNGRVVTITQDAGEKS